MKKTSTYLLIFLFGLFIPAILLFDAAGHVNLQSFIALLGGTGAFSLMALNLFLAARPAFAERLLGGLDKLYVVHKWVGISALVFMLVHENVGMDLEGNIVSTGLAKLSVDVAEIIYPVMLVLILISFIKRFPRISYQIPYHWWRWSHRVLGVLFMGIFFHQFFVKAPFDANTPISLYLNIVGLVGIFSFLYTEFFAPWRAKSYEIVDIEKHPAATLITAKAKNKPISSQAGGFAIISINRNGLREPHPFTISGRPEENLIQFSIRGLGDYTRRLPELAQVGDTMSIRGGYGRFDYLDGEDQQLWIAGGIGITPFLAFADTLDESLNKRIHLVYSVRTEQEALGLERFESAAQRCKNFSYSLQVSEQSGHLTAEKLLELNEGDMDKTGLWFCGPIPMRVALLDGLEKLNRQPASVHFEQFEFR